ncbi:SubName: Full=Related to pig-c protein {ECO:0000313/EMBL:CCA67462.1} [Serendipita indica DSM 11827]|nr:SubName: Full=Related to pig-c protein {ECO:0000313/EMBL:CCA67462.1} [Serendipita indica DSM 11827]
MDSTRQHSPTDDKNWERVLWRRLPYPDNYVPPRRFLESLRKNANFTPYTYSPMVVATTSVCQHIANIFTFLSVFIRLKERKSDPRYIIWISILLFVIGYASWEALFFFQGSPLRKDSRSRVMRSAILVFLALLALAPVLRTLTEATSSDSIWALSFSLFALHTLLADYTAPLPHDSHERLTSVLSMNAAISASVVLASRLDSDLSVFALILFALQVFALFPLLRRQLHYAPTAVRLGLTLLLSTTSVVLMSEHSHMVGWIVSLILIFINFVSPAVMVWAQRYKNEIRGEWDVAVPVVGGS